ncbi:ABC transporter substrate-binding protein [Acuticoccus sediminis]|uniref:ABC transporter substrate-binding protein n=1 Tax=Acuticoccus sediminis TaxID=2184697 RepID=A0A8B2NZC6_9HYPH|nr:TRAP transporter substrate-binding protein [Acuticoccus sediminis]RAI01910.1 ABC transporter substrate-binding protein [Acuticoccus sediminis]
MSHDKFKVALAAAAVTAAVWVLPASAQEVVLKLAHEAPETTIKGQTATRLAELVSEYTNGEVEVQVFPGAQLVPTVEELRAVSRGQVDLVAPYTSYFSAIDEAWNVFYMPTLFASPEQAVEVFAGPVGRSILERVENSGLVGLSIWHDGPVYLFSKDREVKTPADMAGLKTRVAPSAPLEALIEGASATPVALPAPEVYLALQQGVADSVATTPTYAGPSRWNEVLTNGTKVIWGWGGYGLVMNQRSLAKLSDSQREGFMRAVEEAAAWNQEKALENVKHWEDELGANGITWYTPTDEEFTAWQSAGAAIWDEQPQMIKDYITQIQE